MQPKKKRAEFCELGLAFFASIEQLGNVAFGVSLFESAFTSEPSGSRLPIVNLSST